MPDKLVQQEFSELFVKTLLPAFLIVAAGAMIEMKNDKNKISWINIFLSILIAVIFCYLVEGVVYRYSPDGWYTVCICGIALSSEKIIKWFMNNFNIDLILTTFFDLALEKIKKLFR
jgi:predicted permease